MTPKIKGKVTPQRMKLPPTEMKKPVGERRKAGIPLRMVSVRGLPDVQMEMSNKPSDQCVLS